MFLQATLFAKSTLVKPIVYSKIACNQVLYFGRFVVQRIGKEPRHELGYIMAVLIIMAMIMDLGGTVSPPRGIPD